MVIDCLLKSKFVGYTANFTENSDTIIDGADVFFNMKIPVHCWILTQIKCLLEGYLDILIHLLIMR